MIFVRLYPLTLVTMNEWYIIEPIIVLTQWIRWKVCKKEKGDAGLQ